MRQSKLGPGTRAAKTYLDGRKENRPLSLPIVQGVNFQAATSAQLGELFRDKADGMYTRFGHPTLTAVARKVADLEGAESGLCFGSGMGAITTALLTLLRPGDHVVAQREIFAQTFTFLDQFLLPFGVEVDFVDATEPVNVQKAIRSNTAVVYVETPSNPLLKVCDIQTIANACRESGAALLVDSTFASPFLQAPLQLGATLVLHSGTKFLGGHSDVMCGFVAGDGTRIQQIKQTQILLGNLLDPHAAWLVLRGMKTLGLRVERQSENALAIARFLEGQDGVQSVNYPWLDSCPFREVARKQMRMGGGMISFEVAGGLHAARAFSDALEVIPVASSLGGVETIIEIPYDLDFSKEELGESAEQTGIAPGLIRLSVGIEDIADLLTDLERGVQAARQVSGHHATQRGAATGD